MKKDVMYSVRMPSRVREALREAAKKDYLTVASLVNKIITGYLTKEGFLRGPEFGTERRRFPRKKITLPAKTILKAESGDDLLPSVVLNISMDGVLITFPKGSEISFTSADKLSHFELYLELLRADAELCFECEARHIHETGDEIQVGAIFSDPKENYLKNLGSYLM